MAPPAPAAADSEEDGMPKEDPSKLERAPGEENEEVRVCSTFLLVSRNQVALESMGACASSFVRVSRLCNRHSFGSLG